jgi:GT2 family glycosyltransferase
MQELFNSELLDEDIDVIQQMAIWHFANYDTNSSSDWTYSFTRAINLSNILRC